MNLVFQNIFNAKSSRKKLVKKLTKILKKMFVNISPSRVFVKNCLSMKFNEQEEKNCNLESCRILNSRQILKEKS